MGMLATVRRLFSGHAARRVEAVAVPVRARYDAAQDTAWQTTHWAAADAYDADSANSLAVRQKLTKRSRYETANNGHAKGIQLTQANYVIGRGPKLRMQTRSKPFNQMVEARWSDWCKRVKLSRKLRTAVKAKVQDGEGILRAVVNPKLRHEVKLDLVGIETEQMQSPYLDTLKPGRVDGIEFDEFGNPEWYHFYKHHPGGNYTFAQGTERVAAKFVFHLFREDRPGQHRAVPETTPTLNLFAGGRRWREATIAAAENIANFSLFLKSMMGPNVESDQLTALSTLPIEKSMMVTLPSGWDAFQPRAEQPASTYDEFNRSQVCEAARPINMPYNIAAADSSGYSFSGGRLDHHTYFVSVDVEQEEAETLVLDPLFELWFAEAVLAYGWDVPKEPAPAHDWDWPAKPDIDPVKTAQARKLMLGFGGLSLRRLYAEESLDFEDELPAMAEDFGVSEDEMRALLRKAIFAEALKYEPGDEPEETSPPRTGQLRRNGNSRVSSANGNGRFSR